MRGHGLHVWPSGRNRIGATQSAQAGQQGYGAKPQQTAVPSVRRAQAWVAPTLICTKWPLGGDDWPWLSLPQQTAVPSVRNPHVFNEPPLISLNVPPGGEACPSELYPQQTAVPSAFSPHV